MPPLDEVVQKLSQLQASEAWAKDDRQFQPHLATWLNRDGWTEEVPTRGRKSWGGDQGREAAYRAASAPVAIVEEA